MPANNKIIRIIKREDRRILIDAPQTHSLPTKTESESHRDILKTVNSWIEQLREKKQLDLSDTFEA